jgi:O6-methylguanine-DNA--protein-cysteine methyltransferase
MTDEDSGSRRKESPPRGYQDSGGLVPVPDPTLLTTQNLLREIAALKELFTIELISIRRTMDDYRQYSQSRGVDIMAASESLRHFLEERISKLDAVSDQQFSRIAIQFEERDKRTEQLNQAQKEAASALSLASATAIAAALQAQKEAAGAQNDSNAASITKSEAGFTKQIDQITTLVQQIQKGNDDKVADLKGEISRLQTTIATIQAAGTGSRQVIFDQYESRRDQRGGAYNNMTAVSIAVATVVMVVTVIVAAFTIVPHLSH